MRWRERRLLQGLRAGDRRAQEHLLEHVYPRMYAYLCHLCGNAEQAAELAQEAAVRMWRALPKVEARSMPSLLAWTHTVARNVFLDAYRQTRDDKPLEEDTRIASPSDPAAEALMHIDNESLRTSVERLPEIYRQVVVLRFLQGLAYREVAVVLDIPPGTVRSRLAKALELLRQELSHKELCHDV